MSARVLYCLGWIGRLSILGFCGSGDLGSRRGWVSRSELEFGVGGEDERESGRGGGGGW